MRRNQRSIRRRRAAVLAVLVGGCGALAFGSLARAGNQRITDPKDFGKIYPASVYAACDVVSASAGHAGRNMLTHKVVVRGHFNKSGGSWYPNVNLNLNTNGGRRSYPELQINASGEIFKYLPNPGTSPGFQQTKAKARVVVTSHGRAVVFKFKASVIKSLAHGMHGRGRMLKNEYGWQVQTCGEGAVDLAPGGNFFDRTGWTGDIKPKIKYEVQKYAAGKRHGKGKH